jgi:hypothetical protein
VEVLTITLDIEVLVILDQFEELFGEAALAEIRLLRRTLNWQEIL